MLCKDCRKLEALETYPEKISSWAVTHLFPKTLKDQLNAERLKGFQEGYAQSNKHGITFSKMLAYLERIEANQYKHVDQQR